jgi:hypothetical protein
MEFCESKSFSLVDPKKKVKKKKKPKIKERVNKEFPEELASVEDYINDPSYNMLYSSIYDM